MILRFLLLLFLAIHATGCQREEPPPVTPARPAATPLAVNQPAAPAMQSAPPTEPAVTNAPSVPVRKPSSDHDPAVLMEQGFVLQRGETIADSLPAWRRFASQRPALLLLSNDPGLLPPPLPLRSQIADILANGRDEVLRKAGDPRQSAPLFLPGMSVDLALRQGWLRELAWVFPQRDLTQEMKLETLRDQLTENRLIDPAEAETLALDGKVFSGRLRGVPFQAAPLNHLPPLAGPVIVHIDLSYLQRLYKNEIATPVIPLAGGVLMQLKEKKLPVLAVTFSYNHADGGIPLDVRFLGEFLAGLTEKPERLNQPLPRRWQAQKDILYLENFFQKDEIRKLVENQVKDSPESGWVHFNRYRTAALFKEKEASLVSLAEAVRLDRMYALEYLNLAQRAFDAKSFDQALSMMQLAAAAFPADPLLRLQTAELALQAGDRETAGRLAGELRKLPWSPVYSPDMPAYLESLLKAGGPVPPPSSPR